MVPAVLGTSGVTVAAGCAGWWAAAAPASSGRTNDSLTPTRGAADRAKETPQAGTTSSMIGSASAQSSDAAITQ